MGRGISVGVNQAPFVLQAGPANFNLMGYDSVLNRSLPPPNLVIDANHAAFSLTLAANNLQATSSSTGYIKFFGAMYSFLNWKAVAYNSTPLTGGIDAADSDLNRIASYPLPPNQKPSYDFGVKWTDFEPGSAITNANNASQYSIAHVASIINMAQAKFPTTGCICGLYLSLWVVNISTSIIPTRDWSTYGVIPPWVALANGTPANMRVPTNFGSNAAFVSGPAAPIYAGSKYYNLIFGSYNSAISQYQQVLPDIRNPVVVQAFIQMIQWLSTATFTITTGPYANGVNGNPATWTLDTCPCVKLIAEQSEMSNTYNSGPYLPQNVPGLTTLTWQSYMTGYVNLINAIAANLPHTPVAPCVSYGITGATGGASKNQDVAALFNPAIPFSDTSSAAPPRFSPTVWYSNADIYGRDFDPTRNLANQAKLGFTGIGPPGLNGTVYNTTLPPVTTTSMKGVSGAVAQVQPSDWGGGLSSGFTGNTQGAVLNVLSAMKYLAYPYAPLCCGDGVTYDAVPGAWEKYIQPALIANYKSNYLGALLPVNLMQAPLQFSAVVNSPTSVTLSWLAQNGVTYQVTVDGGAPVVAASNSYVATVASGLHTFTVAMTNANGTGPTSSVSATS